jgi:NitT/TauT family transport system substrate-binding protein
MEERKMIRKGFLSLSKCMLIVGLLLGLTAVATAAEKIRFNLDWVIFGRHTGYFTALGKGFYKQQGLDAIVKRGFGSSKAIALMAQGQSDYTFADMGALVLARANDKVPVKAIGVVYARTPHAVHYLEGSGLHKPTDLKGRTVAAAHGGSSIALMFPGFLKAAGISGGVKMNRVQASALNSILLSRKVDGMLDYVFNTVLINKIGKQKGLKGRYFLFSDVGMVFYANALLAPYKTIAQKPDQIRRFVKATFMGLEYSFKHPEEAVDIHRKYNPQVDREAALGELALVKQMMSSPEALEKGMGYMKREKVAGTINVMRLYLNLKKPIKPEEIYTNAFLPGIMIPK